MVKHRAIRLLQVQGDIGITEICGRLEAGKSTLDGIDQG
jgi:hypothetical protein